MTVRDLINKLEQFDNDIEVVMESKNSDYVDFAGSPIENELYSLRGNDRNVIVIKSNGQAGTLNTD